MAVDDEGGAGRGQLAPHESQRQRPADGRPAASARDAADVRIADADRRARRGRRRVAEIERREDAVHVAAHLEPEDDLLSDVTALVEVHAAALETRLLREELLGDVRAPAG